MKPFFFTLLLSLFGAASSPPIPAWGFFGHRKINRQAVFSLPPEMLVFYKKHLDYLASHAVDPDMRRYASPFEAPRHFIDLDRYGNPPFPDLPRNWTDALLLHSAYLFVNEKNDTLPLLERDSSGRLLIVENQVFVNRRLVGDSAKAVSVKQFRQFFSSQILPKYYEDDWLISCDSLAVLFGSDSLPCRSAFAVDEFYRHGVLPYHLTWMLQRLADAFREKNGQKILKLSADFGHYIADAHVPLHTTQNYNGQLTNQLGIHAFWESRLPELYADSDYDFWVGKAEVIEKPQEYFWTVVLESHALVDSVLGIEQDLRKNMPADQQLCNELRGDVLVKTQCEAFAKAYHERLGGMVENRMRAAILSVASAWQTAWVLAGQPDLRSLDLLPDESETKAQDTLTKAFRLGKIFGRVHE